MRFCSGLIIILGERVSIQCAVLFMVRAGHNKRHGHTQYSLSRVARLIASYTKATCFLQNTQNSGCTVACDLHNYPATTVLPCVFYCAGSV